MRARWLLPLLAACAAPDPAHTPAPLIVAREAPAPRAADDAPPPPQAASAPSAAPAPPSIQEVAARTARELERAGLSRPSARRPGDGALARELHPGFHATGARGPDDPAVESSRQFVTRVLDALFHERFGRAPEPPVLLVLLRDAGSYERFCREAWSAACISPYGFYVPTERRLVVNLGPGIGTLSHELVHPIVEADFPGAPTWLNEGIASLFEAPVLARPGEIHGATNWRTPTLKAALATPGGRAAVSLRALFELDDAGFRADGAEQRNYAAARTLCQWLDSRGQLFPFSRAYRDGFATDPRGERAFARVTGTTLEEANPAWLRWAARL
ncbi:MAG: DUF1570 domain-containing protein [Polyangiaceae bacterium]|nr:DUF1570 domain-containing protein [Polyangiaceae bacterium]